MKREVKLLLTKSIDSLIMAIEHFNRPDERGRVTSVLIFLDHSMEMLLKAAIVHRGGDIESKDRLGHKIGFNACVGRALSDGNIQFLKPDQAKIIQAINGQRDAAQHYLVDLSESMLYIHAQSGLTVFRDLLKKVFDIDLVKRLPARVLPISTIPPSDLHTLFETEANEIRKLLLPGARKRLTAASRLRSMIILDKALADGDVQQPAPSEMKLRQKFLAEGTSWKTIFPGVASVEIETEGTGHQINFYLNRKEQQGIPIHIPKDSPDVDRDPATIMIQTINELDKYSLNIYQLGEHLGLGRYQTQAAVWYLKIKTRQECYKEFKRGTLVIKAYSQKAIQEIRDAVAEVSIEQIVEEYKQRDKRSTQV